MIYFKFILFPIAPPSIPRGQLNIMEIKRTSVTISWSPPEHDGGAAVNAYVIERREDLRSTWMRVDRIKAQFLSYTVTGLIEGSQYFFRVMAENVEGLSEALVLSTPVMPVRPAVRPDPPAGKIRIRNVTATSLSIEWNTPYENGGRMIVGYIIESRDVTMREWREIGRVDAYVQSFTVRNLLESKQYLFRVSAVNEIGVSAPLQMETPVRTVKEPGE